MPAVKYIYYPGGTNLPVSLGDDAVGDHISGALPSFDPTIEEVMFGGAAFKRVIEHGNALHTLSWVVDRFHGSIAAALLFRNTHAQSIPVIIGAAQGILQELLNDGTTRYLQNCSRPKVEFLNWDGGSTVVRYSVRYGKATATKNGI